MIFNPDALYVDQSMYNTTESFDIPNISSYNEGTGSCYVIQTISLERDVSLAITQWIDNCRILNPVDRSMAMMLLNLSLYSILNLKYEKVSIKSSPQGLCVTVRKNCRNYVKYIDFSNNLFIALLWMRND